MKGSFGSVTAVASAAVLLLAPFASAEVLSIPASLDAPQTEVAGWSAIIFQFEVPPMIGGEGLEIVTATIDWQQPHILSSTSLRYDTYAPTAPITPQEFGVLALQSVLAEEPVASGVWYPQDYERIGSGRLRSSVLPLVQTLNPSEGGTLQVIVLTHDMEQANWSDLGEGAPVLNVRYGFLGAEGLQALGRQ